MHLPVASIFTLLALAGPAAAATLPPGVTPPVARTEVAAGQGTTIGLAPAQAGTRTVDGDRSDWSGTLPNFGGVLLYSHGELVYEDHYFDAYGADSGQDADRMAVQDPAREAAPETYRVDPALQYVPDEFGIETGPFKYRTNYGDLDHTDEADLAELRLGTDSDRNLWVLARTTTMTTANGTALLLLLDTGPDDAERQVPYNSGLRTGRAEVAVLLIGDRGWSTDLATGERHELPAGSVATNPGGYGNTIEAKLPASLTTELHAVAAATGLADGDSLKTLAFQPNVANVAFRTDEPARDWWDKQQALELQKGSIDLFFADVDNLEQMSAGRNESYVAGPGYHDKHFVSAENVSREAGRNGILQHYGVYLPSNYDADRATPTQYWMHWRGGRAHVAAAVSPGIHHDMGEAADSIVVTPDGRGTDKWYMGKSHVDFLEVWEDSHRAFAIDRDRTYVAGHSMGGWASWLLPVLYPDRFAGTFPAAGLPEWSGANTTPLLENLREVPAVMFHGAADELVPVVDAVAQAQRLQELGYRYRLYVFPGQEHYGQPIVDQWMEGVRYEHQFERNPNPARVTFSRSMPFERTVETYSSDGVPLDFNFNKAYWMSGLEPTDDANGVARFDGRSYAIPVTSHTAFPEAGGPAGPDQAGPYTMNGQAWRTDAAEASETSNGFEATITGAEAVTLNLDRMRLDLNRPLTAVISTDSQLKLTLHSEAGDEVVDLGPGTHDLTL